MTRRCSGATGCIAASPAARRKSRSCTALPASAACRSGRWPWLAGYQGAAPVRVGNEAAGQLQLDVYGEVIAALHLARNGNLREPGYGWSLQVALLEHLETIWREPDEGMWEVRGGRQQFTVSKVFAWMAFDRTLQDCETYGLEGPVERWRAVRDEIHALVCKEGYSESKGCFTQAFGSDALDAGLLLIPVCGFLPPDDARIVRTVAAVERELLEDGFVLRYRTEHSIDGMTGREGAFLACTFWLVDNYVLQGRMDEAHALFERLLSLTNDLGLLSEEYDQQAKRLVGNFPASILACRTGAFGDEPAPGCGRHARGGAAGAAGRGGRIRPF